MRDNWRFPWIHRSELDPDNCHSEKVSPWMNHVADPSWRLSRAMWWFFHGSGGESHFRIASCNWSPKIQSQYLRMVMTKLRYNRRFDLFMSLAIWCRISNPQSDTKLASRHKKTYRGILGHCHQMTCHLERSVFNNEWETGRVRLPTHILDESVHDPENLRCSRPSLLVRKPI